MRHISRKDLVLANLKLNTAVKNQREAIKTALQQDQQLPGWAQKDFWNRHDVRGCLMGYQGLTCAYCESRLEINGAEVDHYRPKNGYPWLAYEWSNLFLSCKTCNNKKLDHFPMLSGECCTFDRRDELADEKPTYLCPSEDAVADAFYLEIKTNQHELKARGARAQRTLLDLALDGCGRADELESERQKKIDDVRKALYNKDFMNLKLWASWGQPFAWTVREILKTLGPEHIPSKSASLFLFVGDLTRKLREHMAHRQKFRSKGDRSQKKVDHSYKMILTRYRWALAALWYAPPVPGIGPVLEQLYQKRLSHESFKLIKRYYDDLVKNSGS